MTERWGATAQFSFTKSSMPADALLSFS